MIPALQYDPGYAPPLRLFGKNYTVACVSANGGVRLFNPGAPANDFICPVENNFGAIAIPSTAPAGIYAYWFDLDSSHNNLFSPIPFYSNAALDTIYCACGVCERLDLVPSHISNP